MAYTNAWDEAAPPGSAAANTLDTIIQNKMKDIRERIEDSLPDWTDDEVDPKRIVVHSGESDDLPDASDANQGEIFVDIEASKLAFFDGEQWVDFAANAVKANLTLSEDPNEQSSAELIVQQTIYLFVSGSPDGNGDVTIDLSEIDIIGDINTGLLPIRIYNPRSPSPTSVAFVREVATTASTITVRMYDTSGNAITTGGPFQFHATLVVAGS